MKLIHFKKYCDFAISSKNVRVVLKSFLKTAKQKRTERGKELYVQWIQIMRKRKSIEVKVNLKTIMRIAVKVLYILFCVGASTTAIRISNVNS